MIITIDGPSGTGKTTVAKRVADRLHFAYFDTGAMYRALTWLILENKVSLEDAYAVQSCIEQFDFQVREKAGIKQYFVKNHDVTEAIRSLAVTQAVSAVSALKQVRDSLLSFQHRFGASQNAVFEGRDLGTVVFPEAQFKVFLTADPLIRAERRFQELLVKNPKAVEGLTHAQVLQDLMRRDEFDSTREVAPLRCPPGAFVVDTSHLCVEEVVDKIVSSYNTLFMRSS